MRAVLVPLDIDLALPPAGSRLRRAAGASMGTDWSVRMMLPPAVDGQLLARALQCELDEIVDQMSHWEPDSLLSRYNRAAAGSWHALPPQFFDVAEYALQVAEDSGWAYDPAAGALVELWGFGPTRRYDQAGFYAPADEAIAALVRTREARRPVLDRSSRRLLQPGGAVLDFSSVAKGYAVDCLARCLERHGVHHYVAEVGGELRGAGVKPDGEPWWVEIEGVPDADAGADTPVVALHGLAVATSGDYRRYFTHAPRGHGARRASHTLDPRSGYPVANELASVSVVATSCMAADALSTALTVLGPEAGAAFADARGIAARFLVRGPGALLETTSAAWRTLLQ
jgi:thiamine biosynthesis lipoprotein